MRTQHYSVSWVLPKAGELVQGRMTFGGKTVGRGDLQGNSIIAAGSAGEAERVVSAAYPNAVKITAVRLRTTEPQWTESVCDEGVGFYWGDYYIDRKAQVWFKGRLLTKGVAPGHGQYLAERHARGDL